MCDHWYRVQKDNPDGNLVCEMCGAELPGSRTLDFLPEDQGDEHAVRLEAVASGKAV